MPKEYVSCSACGRIMVGRVPAGGDGSGLIPYRHKAWGDTCEGSLTLGKILTEKEVENFTA